MTSEQAVSLIKKSIAEGKTIEDVASIIPPHLHDLLQAIWSFETKPMPQSLSQMLGHEDTPVTFPPAQPNKIKVGSKLKPGIYEGTEYTNPVVIAIDFDHELVDLMCTIQEGDDKIAPASFVLSYDEAEALLA